jgi:hypothetical protein
MATVERTCDKRFEGVHEAFAGTADVGLDVGAFLTRRGEVVTDLRHRTSRRRAEPSPTS